MSSLIFQSTPFKFFCHKSACTAFPVLGLTMYSLTANLFTKSHIAECVKSFIWLSIIERNKKNNPHSHSNTVAAVVNSIIGPCNTVVHVVKVCGFSNNVAPSVINLTRPSITDSHVVNNLPGTSSTVAPVVNSLSGSSSTAAPVVNSLSGTSSTVVPVISSLTSPSRSVSLVLQYCFPCY